MSMAMSSLFFLCLKLQRKKKTDASSIIRFTNMKLCFTNISKYMLYEDNLVVQVTQSD